MNTNHPLGMDGGEQTNYSYDQCELKKTTETMD